MKLVMDPDIFNLEQFFNDDDRLLLIMVNTHISTPSKQDKIVQALRGERDKVYEMYDRCETMLKESVSGFIRSQNGQRADLIVLGTQNMAIKWCPQHLYDEFVKLPNTLR